MPKFIDRTNARFGRWLVKSYEGAGRWQCVCDCGVVRTVAVRDMVAGKSTSCGCYRMEAAGNLRRTHGASESRAYTIWLHMRQRCMNPSNLRYPLYGGRGITICDRWSSFENFYADMGDPPHGTSIDRIDNDKGYSPDNCRWATQREQVHNSRSTKLTDADIAAIRADTRPLKVIATEYGVTHTYICALRKGRIRSIQSESKS
jgi:hypothetical protein